MKNKFVVWIDTGVSVELSNDIDIESEDGHKKLKELALQKFKECIKNDQLDITWEELS